MAEAVKFNDIVSKINEALPVHSMWNGFWIRSFKRGTLVVYCSHDMIYGIDFELVFKKVIFFNIPARWNDTNVNGDALLRLATKDEFEKAHPGSATNEHLILAIDMHMEIILDELPEVDGVVQRKIIREWQPYTFYIVAAHVYLNDRNFPNYYEQPKYDDPLYEWPYPGVKNRVGG